MQGASDILKISSTEYDAFIFDLDGVVTDTAGIHASAWKKTFDDYLQQRSTEAKPFEPFDIRTDYTRYVDGMPRYDGVKNFLASRGITLPYGSPDDPPDRETICGIGNKKNFMFQQFLNKDDIKVYDSTIELIQLLRKHNVHTAIISSSKNCTTILELVGILHLFDVKIDGVESSKLGLKGKPEPDIFEAAAQRLSVEPARAVVVEDAISGVMAGRKGKFGLVIGVDRAHQADKLMEFGADVVVPDLSKVILH
ncbi:MAG: beta-phosphoglucomutase family hydrolase [Desulfobacterales bacterium]